MTILEAELENVPIESAAGTWLIGKTPPRSGMSRSPAPPPHIALKENAK
jgi:hypothetical protein